MKKLEIIYFIKYNTYNTWNNAISKSKLFKSTDYICDIRVVENILNALGEKIESIEEIKIISERTLYKKERKII
jgi:hypothetical protein